MLRENYVAKQQRVGERLSARWPRSTWIGDSLPL
jgi:hypothetical protein